MTADDEQKRYRRAEAVMADMMDLPTVDRPAAILSACGDDAELLRRVEALTAAAARADGFLSDPTVDGPSFGTVAPVGEKPGDLIGRYKLLEQIGEGGFGVVFTAEQQKPVRRLVAIKVIKLGMDTREVVARFEAERQALAMMDHPNIAKVFDAGSTESGRPYFVMELVRGLPITEYADKHKMSTQQRVELAAQVCRAVQHAHGKGIVHRDLKPNNVLVTTADDRPVPKVIDFGIAKATQSRLTDRTLYTAHRQLIGTPQYMSPEQADSEGADLDTRSDVYSLGVLVYELLVGTTPFDARALRSAAFEAMRKMIRDTDVPHPATRLHTLAAESQVTIASARSTDAKRLSDAIKGELDWIVMKALEKDRTRRYETAAALADDLGRYLAGDAVLAGPVSGTYRLKKTLKRYKTAVAFGSAIAACLLLGIAGTSIGLVSATHQRDRAEIARTAAIASEGKALQAERRATEQAAVAETEKREALAQKANAEQKSSEAKAMLDFLTDDVLAKAAPENTRNYAVSSVLIDTVIKPALKTIDEKFKDQPLVRAGVQYSLARVLVQFGRYDLAEPVAKAGWTTCVQLRGADSPLALAAEVEYASALGFLDRYPEAERLFKHVWDTRRRLLGDEDPATLRAGSKYAWSIRGQGRFAEAEPMQKRMWEDTRRVMGEDHEDTLVVLNDYALTVMQQGRHAEAEALHKQLWDRQRRVLGEDHPYTLASMAAYASDLTCLGRGAEAEVILKKAWIDCRRVLGEDDPFTLTTLNNYAATVCGQGHYADGEPLAKTLWDKSAKVFGDENPSTLDAKYTYALALGGLGRWAEAEKLSLQVWESRRRVLGDDHTKTLEALCSYGSSIKEQGRFAEAEPLLKQGWDACRRVHGDGHVATLGVLSDYAAAIFAQRRYAEAEGLYDQLWDSERRTYGENDPATLEAQFAHARSVGAQGKWARAEPLWLDVWNRSRRTLGEGHPFTFAAMNQYATALQSRSRNADAEPLFRRVTDFYRRSAPDDGERGPALYNFGQALAAQQKWPEAEAVARENYAWDQTHPAADRKPGTVPGSLRLLNRCLKAQGKPTEPTTLPTTAPTTRP